MSDEDRRELHEMKQRAAESRRLAREVHEKGRAPHVAVSGRSESGLRWTRLVERADLTQKALRGALIGG